MKNKMERGSGTALLLGSLLMIITMGLHPAGGSIEHLIKISSVIIITHSLAIISIPFIVFGFWGLTKRLYDQPLLSTFAFIIICLGMIAVLFAAAVNGLVLPLFLKHFSQASPETINLVKPILAYNTSLNHAFDFIYIGAACAATALWSIAILKTNDLPKWIGYFGMLIALLFIVLLSTGFTLVDLTGFRVFIFGLVSWIVLTGFLIRRPVKTN